LKNKKNQESDKKTAIKRMRTKQDKKIYKIKWWGNNWTKNHQGKEKKQQ
jgi:arginine decarboxylase-like protein